MTENIKIQPTHLARIALVYVRQSTATQLERNTESTQRQYKLVERAIELGWSREQIVVIDEDLGCTGSGLVERSGFEKMASEVALGRVGIILGLEVSRLARNNSDWYRLLDLAGMTDTLIADADGVYHSGLFNDRLVLGLKGTMSEAELHIVRARLVGGIRNKAARGELRLGLPIGFVWGDSEGEIKFHPNEAVVGALRNVFDRFAEVGSARQVWVWFRSQGLSFPSQPNGSPDVRWITPTYTKIHEVLTNPVYAGAYIYGKTRSQRYVDSAGRIRNRMRRMPQNQWHVFIKDHHEGFIDWQTYESNQARLDCNAKPRPREAGGAVREGAALLQGLATCGRCGRNLLVYYQGKNSTPGYYCHGSVLCGGRNLWCLRIGGRLIDDAVAKAFIEAVNPAGLEAAIMAEAAVEADYDASVAQWRLEVERLQYEAQRAERRYRAVDPDNRLVARGLEAEWEKCLRDVLTAETQLASKESARPTLLSAADKERLRALGADVRKVWSAPTTTDRDRKELLRTVLEEVNVRIERKSSQAHLTLRWRGGAVTELDLDLYRRRIPKLRTDEDTIDLVRRLAQFYPDSVIAGILNRQDRHTATGEPFTVNSVGGLRRYWKIPKFQRPSTPVDGELATIDKAAELLGVATSTVHRWLGEGFIAGEQLTPGAPWRIRVNDELRKRFAEREIDGYVPMINATKILGVTRQTVLQRIKRGELEAVYIIRGKRRGMRIKIPDKCNLSDRQLSVFSTAVQSTT